MMKKVLTVITAVLLALSLAACGMGEKAGNLDKDKGADAQKQGVSERSGASAAGATSTDGMRVIRIDAAEAKRMLDEDTDKQLLLVDVRRADEFKASHIDGAINIANEDIKDAQIAALPDKDAKIIVYCKSGNRSAEAADKLLALGYKNVYDMGGINDWSYGTVMNTLPYWLCLPR